jgi:hypothetical protein
MSQWIDPFIGHENKCFIDPTNRDAIEVAKWCRGGTARGFFYTDYYDKTATDILIIFDGYGNTHFTMINHLGRTRRDDFKKCFIVGQDGNVRVEGLGKREDLSCIPCFQKYDQFLKKLASLLGNQSPKLIPMD